MGKKAQAKRARKALSKQLLGQLPSIIFIDPFGRLPSGKLGANMARRLMDGEDGFPVGDGEVCVIFFGDDSLDYAATVVEEELGHDGLLSDSYKHWVETRAKTTTLADQATLVRGAMHPLHVAAALGLTELAEHMLDEGADPNAQFDLGMERGGKVTPLDLAAFSIATPEAALETVDLLFRKGAKATQYAIDAFAKEGFEAVRALVENKLLHDTLDTDDEDRTALDCLLATSEAAQLCKVAGRQGSARQRI